LSRPVLRPNMLLGTQCQKGPTTDFAGAEMRRVQAKQGRTMAIGQARTVWTDQCAATSGIKQRFGARSAFDYLVSEKLMSFAEAAGNSREFARELPGFVAEVRRLFSWQELNEHLSRMEQELERADSAEDADNTDPEDDFADPPALVAARRERFDIMRQMLLEERLGTS
jgi:hypothetical protein